MHLELTLNAAVCMPTTFVHGSYLPSFAVLFREEREREQSTERFTTLDKAIKAWQLMLANFFELAPRYVTFACSTAHLTSLAG